MKWLVFILALLIPAGAFAQEVYDVSCENVARIRIGRIEDTYWNVESYQGHFHLLDLELNPDAAEEMVALRRRTPRVRMRYRGEDYYPPDIAVTANGQPLQNDAPAMTTFCEQAIEIVIIREEDAFAAARAICPRLVPDAVLIDGHWE